MADSNDDGFDKAFNEGFSDDKPAEETPPVTPPADPPKEDPTPEPNKAPEEPKKDESQPAPEAPKEETPPSTEDAPKEEKGSEPAPKTGEEAPKEVPEAPQPLTKEDVASVINNVRLEERNSAKELEASTNEVLEKYYPEGLSNVLTDERTGKELKTPADVVEATNGQMSTEEAAQWLMNEQFKLDKEIAGIKDQARKIAETTINFKRDAIAAVQKYQPLFQKYPHLQEKVYNKLIKQTKVDEKNGVVLSAPDVMEHYDDYLEPYQLAFEHATQQPATNPTPPATPPPATPSTDDRLDDTGDGGPAPVDDPNDFNQQVRKELAKGI